MKIIGKAAVMRHGATRYTGIFPDLAEEGLPGIEATAAEIKLRFPQRPRFISSPADRTVGTALKVLHSYGQGGGQGDIELEPLLQPVAIHDGAAIGVRLSQLKAGVDDIYEIHRRFDEFYMRDPLFEDGGVCEARGRALTRFVTFIRMLKHYCPPQGLVVTTHLELVGSAMNIWFGNEDGYMRPAEAAYFTFFDDRSIHVEFRRQEGTFKL